MGNEYNLKLVGITFEQIAATRMASLNREIRCHVRALAVQDLRLIHDVELDILLTDNMAVQVDRVRQEYGITGFPPYSRDRAAVVPIAITIAAPSVPPARVTVIFDHQLDAWQFDDLISIANRTFWLGHEVGHAIEHGKMKDLPLEALAWSYGAFFRAVASVVRDEYSANLFGRALCKLAFADQQVDGNGLLVGSLGVGHIDSISALCSNLCSFSVEVAAQRCRPQSTPSDLRKLQDTAFSLLQELAIVLTHAVSLHAPSNQDDVLRGKLEKIEGFTSYVAASWADFTAGIADNDRDRGQNSLLRFFDGVLSRLGLRFEDTPQGIYLHFVRVPTLADLLAAALARLSGTVPPVR